MPVLTLSPLRDLLGTLNHLVLVTNEGIKRKYWLSTTLGSTYSWGSVGKVKKTVAWQQLVSFIRGLPSYHHISIKNVWKNITPPFYFDHLPTQLPKYLHYSQNSESAKIFYIFGWLGSHRPICLKRAKKVNFLVKFWSFWDLIWQYASFLSLDNQFQILHSWQASKLNCDIKMKVSFKSQNVFKKMFLQ